MERLGRGGAGISIEAAPPAPSKGAAFDGPRAPSTRGIAGGSLPDRVASEPTAAGIEVNPVTSIPDRGTSEETAAAIDVDPVTSILDRGTSEETAAAIDVDPVTSI
ncbi:MAG TPA: hypothetical protein VHV30_09650, partial [Polyangiaceae bacterium]|nr:hypothetical protein [Polyangiaceae bacterium]